MPSQRGLGRILTFADAVVAIAITLLVLPLVDLAAHGGGQSADRLVSGHLSQFGAFALSFVVIAQLWIAHRKLFEEVGGYDPMIIRLTLLWLFTVAFLPFPTAVLATGSGQHGASTLYVGTLLASSLALAATSAWVGTHPALQLTAGASQRTDESHWTTAILLTLAFAMTTLLPSASVWPLLLLVLTGPVNALRRRRSGPPATKVRGGG
jgi:uncharacterized membrane protein